MADASLSTLVSYPALIPYEEALEKNPYDVKGWTGYLAEIDEALDVLGEKFDDLVRGRSTGSGAGSKKKGRNAASSVEVGGRTIRLDAVAAGSAVAVGRCIFLPGKSGRCKVRGIRCRRGL